MILGQKNGSASLFLYRHSFPVLSLTTLFRCYVQVPIAYDSLKRLKTTDFHFK
jgi:hypothetical protein